MTTTTTKGTPSPQTWTIILTVAALGFVALLAWSQGFGSTSVTGQQQAEETTATLPEAVNGFEYNNEATAGHSVAPGITGDYFGYSGELNPEAVSGATDSGLAKALADGRLDAGFANSGPTTQASQAAENKVTVNGGHQEGLASVGPSAQPVPAERHVLTVTGGHQEGIDLIEPPAQSSQPATSTLTVTGGHQQ